MIKKLSLLFVAFLFVIVVLAFVPYNPEPLTRQQIVAKTYQVFEYSGVYAPHNLLLKPDGFEKHQALFDKVEAGEELNTEQSKEYRLVYQSLLVKNQFIFDFLDSNLSLQTNVNMDIENNVGGKGIADLNDHHDASIRSNLADALESMESVKNIDGMFSKIQNAKTFYKNTMDIMLHLGTVPQVKSTRYKVQNKVNDNQVSQLIESSLQYFKKAQFENINSPAYWQAIRQALDIYVEAVTLVQKTVQDNLTPFERSIVGTWDSLKNLAPITDNELNVRVAWLAQP